MAYSEAPLIIWTYVCGKLRRGDINMPVESLSRKNLGQALFRPCKKSDVGFLQSTKAVFDSRIRLCKNWPEGAFSAQLFSLSDSTVRFSKKNYRVDPPLEKVSRKRCEPIALLNLHKTHTNTPIPGTTQQNHTTAPTLAPRLSLLLLLAASQSGAFLALPASSVYHTMAAARGIDVILPTTATPAVTLAALG